MAVCGRDRDPKLLAEIDAPPPSAWRSITLNMSTAMPHSGAQ
jgi:hypothetical protein